MGNELNQVKQAEGNQLKLQAALKIYQTPEHINHEIFT
jgi:hypothetical protein